MTGRICMAVRDNGLHLTTNWMRVTATAGGRRKIKSSWVWSHMSRSVVLPCVTKVSATTHR
jgi:hypothetical protein